MSVIAFGQQNDFLNLGVGVGIQTHPVSLDPNEFVEKYPILYPTFDLRTPLINRINLSCNISRTVIKSSLFGYIEMPQLFEVRTVALGLDYDFIERNRTFSIGSQFLLSFGEYRDVDYSDPGLGLRLYALGMQPITRHFLWVIRTSIQRTYIGPTQQYRTINLDSFSVELLCYLSL